MALGADGKTSKASFSCRLELEVLLSASLQAYICAQYKTTLGKSWFLAFRTVQSSLFHFLESALVVGSNNKIKYLQFLPIKDTHSNKALAESFPLVPGHRDVVCSVGCAGPLLQSRTRQGTG